MISVLTLGFKIWIMDTFLAIIVVWSAVVVIIAGVYLRYRWVEKHRHVKIVGILPAEERMKMRDRRWSGNTQRKTFDNMYKHWQDSLKIGDYAEINRRMCKILDLSASVDKSPIAVVKFIDTQEKQLVYLDSLSPLFESGLVRQSLVAKEKKEYPIF